MKQHTWSNVKHRNPSMQSIYIHMMSQGIFSLEMFQQSVSSKFKIKGRCKYATQCQNILSICKKGFIGVYEEIKPSYSRNEQKKNELNFIDCCQLLKIYDRVAWAYAIFRLSILLFYLSGGGGFFVIHTLRGQPSLFTVTIEGEDLMICIRLYPSMFLLLEEF